VEEEKGEPKEREIRDGVLAQCWTLCEEAYKALRVRNEGRSKARV